MTITVFTTVIGETDPLRRPTVSTPDVRYVCVTDQSHLVVPPYEMVRIPQVSDAKLLSRQIKIQANHPALGTPDYTLWHDAAFQLLCDPRSLIPQLADADVLALRHPHRDQIADEADAIANLGYVPRAILDQQLAAYSASGFRQSAITSTGLCLRRMTPTVRKFNDLWWFEVSRWHWRDQMSVDYALWCSDLGVRYWPGHYRENPYAKWYAMPQPITRRRRA